MTFGAVICKRREDMGLTQRHVANRAGISNVYVHDLEYGNRGPSAAVTERLARVLGFDRDYLDYLCGRWPDDVVGLDFDEDRIALLLGHMRTWPKERKTLRMKR